MILCKIKKRQKFRWKRGLDLSTQDTITIYPRVVFRKIYKYHGTRYENVFVLHKNNNLDWSKWSTGLCLVVTRVRKKKSEEEITDALFGQYVKRIPLYRLFPLHTCYT